MAGLSSVIPNNVINRIYNNCHGLTHQLIPANRARSVSLPYKRTHPVLVLVFLKCFVFLCMCLLARLSIAGLPHNQLRPRHLLPTWISARWSTAPCLDPRPSPVPLCPSASVTPLLLQRMVFYDNNFPLILRLETCCKLGKEELKGRNGETRPYHINQWQQLMTCSHPGKNVHHVCDRILPKMITRNFTIPWWKHDQSVFMEEYRAWNVLPCLYGIYLSCLCVCFCFAIPEVGVNQAGK